MTEDKEYPKYAGSYFNIPLKKPKAYKFERTLYQSIGEFQLGGSTDFIPTWDSTDHFHFCCQNCESMADVLKVDYIPPS